MFAVAEDAFIEIKLHFVLGGRFMFCAEPDMLFLNNYLLTYFFYNNDKA